MHQSSPTWLRALFARLSLLLLFCVSACGGDTAKEQQRQGAVELSECRLSGFGDFRKAKALCGSITVPLNPEDPGGKTINLSVAKIPALTRKPAPSAFTLIAGGPGQSALESYVGLKDTFDRIRSEHDIILVDQRGTGDSNKQQCESSQDDAGALIEQSPEAARKAALECLAILGDDVQFYTTSIAVQDLDQVRESMGYAQLNLYGVSYGTRVAQHYLRRYPQKTRTVILDGIVPVSMPLGPELAIDAQNALNAIFDRCHEESLCYEKFGDLHTKFSSLSAKLKDQPVEFDMNDPISGETIAAKFGYGELVMAIRLMSYSPDSASLLPLMINNASEGNYVSLATQALLNGEMLAEMLALGMHNSIVCAEDVPFFDTLDITPSDLQKTYMGELAYLSLVEICKIWPQGPTDADFKEPIDSTAPVLLLSGEFDPVTPPVNAALAAQYLSNSHSIVVNGQGHNVGPIGCLPRVMADFVIDGSHQELDTACVDVHQASPFFNSFSGSEP